MDGERGRRQTQSNSYADCSHVFHCGTHYKLAASNCVELLQEQHEQLFFFQAQLPFLLDRALVQGVLGGSAP